MKTSSKSILFIILLLALPACTESQYAATSDTIGKVLKQGQPVTTDEVTKGLKEALTQGISKGSLQASQVDGYFKNALLKILIPPEMQQVDQKLRSLGFSQLMNDFELSLNRGAEEAAKEAKPIFVQAIISMTVQDAWTILRGPSDAATSYLQKTTSSSLHQAFQPVIQRSLQNVNATKYYTQVVNTYNKIPLVKPIDPHLDQYVTNRAIEGLFVLIRQEEANIRANPVARATELLKRVFAKENVK